MKSLHLGLALIFIMLVVICTKPVHADYDLIKILDVQVQPSTIKINNTFSVSATILNNSTYPVYLTSGSCVPAFSVEFDSHSKQVYPDIACTLEAIEQRVDRNVETTISSVNKPGTIYKAIQAGTANANITIPYFIKNQTATDDSNIYYNTSKSFSFPILNQSETSKQHVYGGGGPVVTITLDPLEQFKSGISAKDVTCKEGLQLVIKAEDGSPVCVKPETANVLVERGWAKQESYNIDPHVQPKVTLNDYWYNGIEKDNTTVSINNQTYYQTTLSYEVYNLTKGISVQFQKTIFAFPEGVVITPSGNFIILDIKFPDGSEEIYGRNTIYPDGSGAMGGIRIPSPFGPPAITTVTVLSNHLVPQAGITIFHDKIKLLVSNNQSLVASQKLSR